MNELKLHKVPFNHLYADLSYAEFFGRYCPRRDGRAHAATYSFNHKDIKFWWRLAPTSVLYIAEKYAHVAQKFVRRFPLFVVHVVPDLHTKAVFFERSGVLLIGSQNIYASKSKFSEVMLETVVSEDQRQNVIDFVFGRLRGRQLSAVYGLEDIRIHATGLHAEGRPFVPSQREIAVWDIIGPPPVFDQPPDGPKTYLSQQPQPRTYRRWIYHVKQYDLQGTPYGVAFDRGYVYCGDLDAAALEWLVQHCEVIEKRPGCGPIEQSDKTMAKDRFYRFHPIAGTRDSEIDLWFGPVKNRSSFRNLEENVPGER